MPYKDPIVRRAKTAEYMRRRYQTDPEYRAAQRRAVRINNANTRALVQQIINEAKAGGCLFCAEKEPCCMSFHHRDPAAKDFNIGDAVGLCVSSKRLRAELAKCVRLCHNCHAKLHAGIVHLT